MPIMYSAILTEAQRNAIGSVIDKAVVNGQFPNTGAISKFLNTQFPTGRVIYRDGSKRTVEDYTDMLVRTTVLDIRRNLVREFVRNNQTDLVMVSVEGSQHPECAIWEGQVFSESGANPNFLPLDAALGGSLFHPRCIHTLWPIYNDDLESEESDRLGNLTEIIDGLMFAASFAVVLNDAKETVKEQEKLLDPIFDLEYELEDVSETEISVIGALAIKNTGESKRINRVVKIGRKRGPDSVPEDQLSGIRKLRKQ